MLKVFVLFLSHSVLFCFFFRFSFEFILSKCHLRKVVFDAYGNKFFQKKIKKRKNKEEKKIIRKKE